MSTPPPPTAQEPSDIVGQMAGEYRLRRKLGEGGYGAVYEAEHPVLKRKAAVKVLHRASGGDSDGVRRFISEAQAATQIRSRHIVDIFSFGTLPDGRHFYVMDLLEGEPLDRFIAREKRLEVAAALQLLRPLAEALDAAHAADIIHRDLKPQNIFLIWQANGDTVPKLLDFGTAKLLGHSPVHTMSGTVIGTPLYMSPEQALGQAVDARADIYALGLLCHELLTGAPPITGTSAIAVLAAHLAQKPPRVSEAGVGISVELDAPILRMLEKDPHQRPAAAGAAIEDLVRAAERAGLVIPAGMPRLAKPPAPLAEAADASLASEPRWSSHSTSERGLQRDTSIDREGTTTPRRWIVPLLAAVAVLAAALSYGLSRADREGSAGGGSASASAASASAPAVFSAAPAPPTWVAVTVQGAPRGAHIALDGAMLGEAPGPVALRYGEQPLQLSITAPGYEPAQLFVVPNQFASATVSLRKRPPGPGSAPARERIPSDLESPF